jgi:hypothetical protein
MSHPNKAPGTKFGGISSSRSKDIEENMICFFNFNTLYLGYYQFLDQGKFGQNSIFSPKESVVLLCTIN